MKKIGLFMLFASVSVASFSQVSWNAKVGMNISDWSQGETKAKIGYAIGGGMEYAFNETFAIQPSLFLSSKGVKSDGGEDGFKKTCNQVYLQLPVVGVAKVRIGENLRLAFSAGAYLACGVGGRTKSTISTDIGTGEASINTFGIIDEIKLKAGGKTVNMSLQEYAEFIEEETNITQIDGLKREDYGIELGVGLEFNHILVGLNGELGLAKIQNNGPKNQNLAITVGYKF